MKKIIILLVALFCFNPAAWALELIQNRVDSLVFIGISTTRNFYASVYPFTAGFYLGQYFAVGAEYGTGHFEISTNLFNNDRQRGDYTTSGGYLRFYPMRTLNFYLGYYHNTWQGDFHMDVCSGFDIFCLDPVGQIDTEMEVETNVAVLGISNQWILDFGLTITGDWFGYNQVVGSKKTTAVKENSYSQDLNDDAQDAIDDLADDAVRISGLPGVLTLTLTWSF